MVIKYYLLFTLTTIYAYYFISLFQLALSEKDKITLSNISNDQSWDSRYVNRMMTMVFKKLMGEENALKLIRNDEKYKVIEN